jgi:hypothetical protein
LQKTPSQERAGGVTQDDGPEFKPQYCKNNKKPSKSKNNRSRANTTRGLDYEHMIKARAHKGGVRIGKTPKKLASICCP